jgi:beta-glucanase (GH16 family)
MRKPEPVQSIAALAVLATVVFGAQPASAAPVRVSLALAAPTRGSVVNDTATISFTGNRLKTITVYWRAREIATATVRPDGTGGTAQVDTLRLPDGPAVLNAVGKGTGSAAYASIVLKVDNRHADRRPAGFNSLVFHDEFSGTSLNRRLWCTRYQYDGGSESPAEQAWIDKSCLGRDPATGAMLGTLDSLGIAKDANGNPVPGQEQEVYRDLHTVQDGYLALHAQAGHVDPAQPYLNYTSSMIRSKAEFQPTANHPLYLTARLNQPDVKGSWPAFWLAGGYGDGHVRPPWPPEIDILEGPLNASGQYANQFHTGVQNWGCGDPCPEGPFDYTDNDANFDTQWGDYHSPNGSLKETWIEVGLLWFTDHVCWYLDGLKLACQGYHWITTDGVAANTTPATVLLNLAVGGPWAGADGVDDAAFPTWYGVDHVRIYRR